MLLLVGLGNPGSEHKRQRHNVGFMAADAIADRHNFQPFKKRFHGEVAEGVLDGIKTLLLKPLTYMNLSGKSVGEAAHFYKLPPAQVVVMHDELDLAAGKIRIKTGGGHAGHNGLRSIDASIGPDYRRLRIGIGHPGKDRVLGYVLQNFHMDEHLWLDPLLDAMAREAGYLARNDDAGFMTKVALLLQPPKVEKPRPDKPAPVKTNKTDSKDA
ncbi:MAG: aminoacyl-tRNA hydrolase [Ferrovibrio sp.]|uniref:aminoacyl-tRNA hydrolase n=1 Tax=Ferrovibrio sp. TaxID=1917215 RepID=UPI0026108CF7|nr:aminoacyl-tRNA hydrolase [Ferrovibrio sp.]MCW0236632.1 aminoacyl-tRNA hydrolase [Ferrovibrio sp.]